LDNIFMERQQDRRRGSLIASISVLVAAAALLYVLRGVPQRDITGLAEDIDGDSVRLNGEELRLRGIDAPELFQTCRVSGRETACGREARAALRKLLTSGLATCIGGERDRYGRLLVVCRIRGIDVNAAMVRDGQAVSFGSYEAEEAEAKAAYRGLWAGEFERPRDWRARHPRSSGTIKYPSLSASTS
jgi:endonuclease YncB( thermonuclease family)